MSPQNFGEKIGVQKMEKVSDEVFHVYFLVDTFSAKFISEQDCNTDKFV